jgi:hypothetical protein
LRNSRRFMLILPVGSLALRFTPPISRHLALRQT